MSALGAAAGVALAWAMTRIATSISLPIPIPLSFALQDRRARAALHRRRHDGRRARRRPGAGAQGDAAESGERAEERRVGDARRRPPLDAARRAGRDADGGDDGAARVGRTADPQPDRGAARRHRLPHRRARHPLDRDEHARLRRRPGEGVLRSRARAGARAARRRVGGAGRAPAVLDQLQPQPDFPARSAWA